MGDPISSSLSWKQQIVPSSEHARRIEAVTDPERSVTDASKQSLTTTNGRAMCASQILTVASSPHQGPDLVTSEDLVLV